MSKPAKLQAFISKLWLNLSGHINISGNSVTKGQRTEAMALKFLRRRGLKIIDKNFRARCGEIDLIMRDQECLVFVEVRYRHNTHYGSSIETIGLAKQRKIIKTAEYYLLKNQKLARLTCRFDIIAIDTDKHGIDIKWVKNAFGH